MDLTIVRDIEGFVVCVLEGHVKPVPEVMEQYDTYGTSLLYVTHHPDFDLSMTLDNALDGGIGVKEVVDA